MDTNTVIRYRSADSQALVTVGEDESSRPWACGHVIDVVGVADPLPGANQAQILARGGLLCAAYCRLFSGKNLGVLGHCGCRVSLP